MCRSGGPSEPAWAAKTPDPAPDGRSAMSQALRREINCFLIINFLEQTWNSESISKSRAGRCGVRSPGKGLSREAGARGCSGEDPAARPDALGRPRLLRLRPSGSLLLTVLLQLNTVLWPPGVAETSDPLWDPLFLVISLRPALAPPTGLTWASYLQPCSPGPLLGVQVPGLTRPRVPLLGD